MIKNMKITITKNEKEFDCTAAWRIIGQMLNEPESVIGLSTGRTTGNLHRLVGEIYTKYPFKVDTVTFFGLDEVTNVPREYAGACYTMLKTELMDTLGIKEENFLMLPTILVILNSHAGISSRKLRTVAVLIC